MTVTVKCFAGFKEAVGSASLVFEAADNATVGDVFNQLARDYPGVEPYRGSVMLAVNREYARHDTVLTDGDELACIPPVSGGLGT